MSSLLKTISINIESCFAIKWLKYCCNKGILSIQMIGEIGKFIFCPFLELFPFQLKSKISDVLFFLLFCHTEQWCDDA